MFNLRRLKVSSRLLRRSRKGGKKKDGEDEGTGDAIEQIGERYLARFPDDPQQQQQPKKINVMLSIGHIFLLKNDRVRI